MAKVATKPASNSKTTSSNGNGNGKAVATKDTSLYGKLRAAIYSSRAFSRAKLPTSPDAEVYTQVYYAARSLATAAANSAFRTVHGGKKKPPTFDYKQFNQIFSQIYGNAEERSVNIQELVEIGKRLSPRVSTAPDAMREMILINVEEMNRMNLQRMLNNLRDEGGFYAAPVDELEGDLEDLDDIDETTEEEAEEDESDEEEDEEEEEEDEEEDI